MLEAQTRPITIENRDERKARTAIPQVLRVLGAESTPKDGITSSQIQKRVNALPSTRDFEPVGQKTISRALAILLQESGEIVVAKEDLDPDSPDKRGNPTRQKFYALPTPEEHQAETASFPVESAGPVDGIPGFKQAWEKVQKGR